MIKALKRMLCGNHEKNEVPDPGNTNLFTSLGFPKESIDPHMEEFCFIPGGTGYFPKPDTRSDDKAAHNKEKHLQHLSVYQAIQPLYLKPMKPRNSGQSAFHDTYSYEMIGFDNWAPLPVAMLYMCQETGRELIREMLYQVAFVGTNSPAALQWIRANEVAMIDFANILEAGQSATDMEEGEDQQGFKGLGTNEVLSIYLRDWQINNVKSNGIWLSTRDRHNAYYRIPLVKEFFQTRQTLCEKNREWAFDWLESCGASVDRNLRMVNIPGYLPLVIKSHCDI